MSPRLIHCVCSIMKAQYIFVEEMRQSSACRPFSISSYPSNRMTRFQFLFLVKCCFCDLHFLSLWLIFISLCFSPSPYPSASPSPSFISLSHQIKKLNPNTLTLTSGDKALYVTSLAEQSQGTRWSCPQETSSVDTVLYVSTQCYDTLSHGKEGLEDYTEDNQSGGLS